MNGKARSNSRGSIAPRQKYTYGNGSFPRGFNSIYDERDIREYNDEEVEILLAQLSEVIANPPDPYMKIVMDVLLSPERQAWICQEKASGRLSPEYPTLTDLEWMRIAAQLGSNF
ncbi:hypothetical protein H0H93_002141 [Arthromyces matolae]|nr:hypothetical protein H0H93_002141 [Arthromyces matolae]